MTRIQRGCLLLLLVCFGMAPAMAEDSVKGTALEARVRRLGRYMSGQPEGIYLSWTDSGVEFAFEGETASARMGLVGNSRPVLMGVFVDGETSWSSSLLLEGGMREYILAEELGEGEHTLRLLKLSEAMHGTVLLESLHVDGNGIRPTEAKERRIEFIGDSMTCGFGTLAQTEDASFTTAEEDGSLTCGFLVAATLDADAEFVCTSGIGVYASYGGDRANVMSAIYPYSDPYAQRRLNVPQAQWQRWSEQAGLVVLHLGTNDETVVEGDERLTHAFVVKYAAFLNDVRTMHPQAQILATYGVMTEGLSEPIQAAISLYQQQTGDERIGYYQFDSLCKFELGGVSAGHPSALTHENMAFVLEEEIVSLMNLED